MGFKEEERFLKAKNGSTITLVCVLPDPPSEIFIKFDVSKAQLEEGLKFVDEANGDEQRQARLRHIISSLIATSHK